MSTVVLYSIQVFGIGSTGLSPVGHCHTESPTDEVLVDESSHRSWIRVAVEYGNRPKMFHLKRFQNSCVVMGFGIFFISDLGKLSDLWF